MTFMKIENSLQSKNISQIQKIFANPEKIFALSKVKLGIKKTSFVANVLSRAFRTTIHHAST